MRIAGTLVSLLGYLVHAAGAVFLAAMTVSALAAQLQTEQRIELLPEWLVVAGVAIIAGLWLFGLGLAMSHSARRVSDGL